MSDRAAPPRKPAADALKKRRNLVVDRVKSALSPANVALVESPRSGGELRPLAELLFDATWYAERYPEAALDVRRGKHASLRTHYEESGFRTGLRPSAVFVPSAYTLDPRSGYQAAAGIDPINHYLRSGAGNRASPHWLFDERYYLERSADVAAAVQANSCTSGYHHFLATGAREGRRPHPLFNDGLYGVLNGVAPHEATFLHYACQGAFAEAATSGLFDREWYASVASDVVPHTGEGRGFDCLLHHFVQYGAVEGRAPIPDFDAEFYLRTQEAARQSLEVGRYRCAVEHWIYEGVGKGLDPNRFFDSRYYGEKNPEIFGEIARHRLLGPFEHFLLFGRKQGLRCNPPLVSLHVDEEQAKVAFARRARTSALVSRSRKPRHADPRHRPGEAPDVSIVIPVHDQADYTYHLLQDLLSRRSDSTIEIIVVDDASTDETRDLSKYFPDVRVLRNEVNEGFPSACNRGLLAATGEIVVFANNDIEVLPGAIDALVDRLREHPDVGAVGPRIVRMHGRLQEAGGTVHPDGSTAGYGRDDDPDAARYGWCQDVHYCSAVFLAVRRELLRAIGGFDAAYSPGYYEEVDLCARVWASGHRVVVEPCAVVYHFEHASFLRGRPPSAMAVLMHRHRQRFAEKNREFVSTSSPRLVASPTGAIGHAPGRRSVLFIEDFLPLPFIGSGFPRASRIVRALTELGYRVVVYALFRHPAGNWLDARDLLPPTEVHYDDESSGVLEELLLSREFAAVWMCRTHNLQRVLQRLLVVKALRHRPRLVLDTEALASNRTAALRALNAGREAIDAELSAVRAELAGVEAFDSVVAVNELERRQIADALPKGRVTLVGHEASANPGYEPLEFSARSGFLFVGSVHAEVSPNHEGLSWFVEEVWPEIRKQDRGATLTIAGYWDARVPRPAFLSLPGVEFLGAVADLSRLYAGARVFVAPVRFAAGIPLKVQEAAAHGLPCVATQILARQIGLRQGEDAVIASALNPKEFARRALELYRGEALWERVRQGALARVRQDWSHERFAEGIRSALGLGEKPGPTSPSPSS